MRYGRHRFSRYIFSVSCIYQEIPLSDYSILRGQKTFLAHSADKQTSNYDTECSNHHSLGFLKIIEGGRSRFSCKNGGAGEGGSIHGKGTQCFSLIMYGFCGSNALYSASHLIFHLFFF